MSLPQEIVLATEQVFGSCIEGYSQLPMFVLLVKRYYEFILRCHRRLESLSVLKIRKTHCPRAANLSEHELVLLLYLLPVK